MIDPSTKQHYAIETVEEDPGQFTWRIVCRDTDTGQQVGAPVVSTFLYENDEAARAAASETLRKLVAGSFVSDAPRANG